MEKSPSLRVLVCVYLVCLHVGFLILFFRRKWCVCYLILFGGVYRVRSCFWVYVVWGVVLGVRALVGSCFGCVLCGELFLGVCCVGSCFGVCVVPLWGVSCVTVRSPVSLLPQWEESSCLICPNEKPHTTSTKRKPQSKANLRAKAKQPSNAKAKQPSTRHTAKPNKHTNANTPYSASESSNAPATNARTACGYGYASHALSPPTSPSSPAAPSQSRRSTRPASAPTGRTYP